jgi:DUF1680 family protein
VTRFMLLMMLSTLAGAALAAPAPVRDRVAPRMPDTMELLPPSDVRLEGYLGARVARSEKNRLLAVNEDELLAGFRSRPGRQAWIGEHVGKWLHAATLAWVYTGDLALRAKLDRVVTELLKTQEPDGYLGTYVRDRRFGLYPGADWDVWVHKYNLIGLLTYHRYTGSAAALEGARRVGDLLIATFGPGQKSILSAGTHVGMAATSVLEPMVLLYRTTGDERYLDFARYLVQSWDEPNGPRILASLTTTKAVNQTANGKAYEMLSNLVGLCELARATGERRYLEAPVHAWQDVVANHLYLTGTASQHEHFHAPHELPNQPGANIGETCVTVTWIQLNAQLLRLTGEARYGDELERSYYNHLAAAQRPDGAQWCYYTALEGTKPYGGSTNCCLSSGPRGMALAPQLAYLKYRSGNYDGLAVNLFEASRASVRLDGQLVKVEQRAGPPGTEAIALTFRMDEPAAFALQIRAPACARSPKVRVLRRNDGEVLGSYGPPSQGWVTIPARRWRNGDRVAITLPPRLRLVMGEHSNAGLAALVYGPLVLAYDEGKNPGLPPADSLALVDAGDPPFRVSSGPGEPLAFEARVRSARDPQPRPAVFIPFAEAGADGSRYRVWLRALGTEPPPVEPQGRSE